MNILLIDIDSTIPNLALKKIEAYHLSVGDTIHWNMPLMRHAVDKIYVSCIFTKNKELADEWAEYGAEVGGTGYDLKIKLPKHIEEMPLRINWGFTTRGCIRKCSFCFVPEKEGLIYAVGDLYDVWDGISKEVVLMDNNILTALSTILTAAGTILTYFLAQLAKKHSNNKDLDALIKLADEGVAWAEAHVTGSPDKLSAAVDYVSSEAADLKIKFSSKKIEAQVEASLVKLKKDPAGTIVSAAKKVDSDVEKVASSSITKAVGQVVPSIEKPVQGVATVVDDAAKETEADLTVSMNDLGALPFPKELFSPDSQSHHNVADVFFRYGSTTDRK